MRDISAQELTCRGTAPLRLPKEVTKKSSVNHISSFKEPPSIAASDNKDTVLTVFRRFEVQFVTNSDSQWLNCSCEVFSLSSFVICFGALSLLISSV